jgi:predicted GNAT family acetyltransferase/predicted GIY-YIG superfamily endonuclease
MRQTKTTHERGRDPGFVYVLHFNEQLGGKAVHYIGCTSDPAGRFACHAAGNSSSIMRACTAQGVSFRLGALGRTHRRGMRRLEAQAKAWKNADVFCEVCQGQNAKAIPGTQPQPLDMLPFPVCSEAYPKKAKPITVGLSSPRTPVYLVTAMRTLSETEKDALGFIPMGGSRGVNDYIETGNVVLAVQGRDLVGYLLFGKGNGQEATIQQTVVADRVRGTGIGRRMIACVRDKLPRHTLWARVRSDLEANGFWGAVGFRHVETTTHSTSCAALNVWMQEPKGEQLQIFDPNPTYTAPSAA